MLIILSLFVFVCAIAIAMASNAKAAAKAKFYDLLLDCVEQDQYEFLYNKSHPDFKNSQKKADAWSAIGAALHCKY